MVRALVGLLIILLVAAACGAQDRDGDGLPDDIETRLGTNPQVDEGLELIIDDLHRGEGDTNNSGGQAPDVSRVFFAHVAGDRYVWKITFAGAFLQHPELSRRLTHPRDEGEMADDNHALARPMIQNDLFGVQLHAGVLIHVEQSVDGCQADTGLQQTIGAG